MQKIVKSPCSVGQLQATRLQPHLQQPWQRTFATDEAVRRQRTTFAAATDSEKVLPTVSQSEGLAHAVLMLTQALLQ